MTSGPKAVHGGAFFDAIGITFDDLNRRHDVVSADVLDAWYPPTPLAIDAVRTHLEWLMQTSPPTHADGLRQVVAEARGLDPADIVLGAGTSALMFQAFPMLVPGGSRVVVLDPAYGEYPHLIETVLGATADRFELDLDAGFTASAEALAERARGARGVVIVNPNSPTGTTLTRAALRHVLAALPEDGFLWLDETYVDYVDARTETSTLTMEPDVARDPRLIVAKSMSKFYALSGVRVGYLATRHPIRAELDRRSPPWNIGLIGQVAATAALRDSAYYRARADETAVLRAELSEALAATDGIEVVPSVTNYVMARLPRPVAADLAAFTASRGVFIRNCDSLSPRMRGHYIRVAVKPREQNVRIIDAIRAGLLI
ncbi:MAG: histidinol-phosphate transaminase [Fimbriimonadaceae bacterium]|nr:histidinol-phosphate transaminase [Fimbriimonadaceae bacterium]